MHPRHPAVAIAVALALATLSSTAAAAHCPSPDNLVANCGFDIDTTGYDAQVGDLIAFEPDRGASAVGSMRVGDTEADANAEAEAETCVDVLPESQYRIGADFLAETALQCFVGWDEFAQPGCQQPNGVFQGATPVDVNDATFTRFETVKTTSSGVASIELVIVCNADGTQPTQFLVDDVYVLSEGMFSDGFEPAP